jgi:hypothetical protein
MWGIENPAKVFSYLYAPTNADFEFAAIINTEKYDSFPFQQRKSLEELNLSINDVRIKTPDNPAVLKKAKFISFSR